MENPLKNCTFCGEAAIATITTTTPSDAFPFLCSQLKVRVQEAEVGGPPSLCHNCHNCWEEVVLLYSNMQGLVNLLGRRVEHLKKNITISHPQEEEQGFGADTQNCEILENNTEGEEAPSSSILGWWYGPSSSTSSPIDAKNSVNPLPHPDIICNEGVATNMKIKTEFYQDEEEEEMEMSELLPNLSQRDEELDEHPDPDPEYHPQDRPKNSKGKKKRHHRSTPPRPRPTPQHQKPTNSTKFELITTRRGNKKVFVSGYTYLYAKSGIGKKIWRCEIMENGRRLCCARLHTTEDMSQLLAFVGRHNHPPIYTHRSSNPHPGNVANQGRHEDQIVFSEATL